MKIEKVYQSKNRRGVTKMAVVSLENNIKIYSSELSHTLLKVSNYKLDERKSDYKN